MYLATRRDFVTVWVSESIRATCRRGGKIVVRTDSAAPLVDDCFVLFNCRHDGSLEPRTESRKLAWHGTEEVLGACRLRDVARDSMAALVEAARPPFFQLSFRSAPPHSRGLACTRAPASSGG